MGSSNNKLKDQVINYYMFHKKIECFFKDKFNPFYNPNDGIKIENFYIINTALVKKWKIYCNYDMKKMEYDEIYNKCNVNQLKNKLEKRFEETYKETNIINFNDKFNNDLNVINSWYCRNMLTLDNFDNILDETTYKCFQDNLIDTIEPNIKGIITNERIILFYEKLFMMKFLFYGDLADPKLGYKFELIQITSDFCIFVDGDYLDDYTVKSAFEVFKNIITRKIEYPFDLFEKNNIKVLQEVKINFQIPIDFGFFGYYETISLIIKNENLTSKFLNESYQTVNFQNLDYNKVRLIGLANVGATCYMNATLQCLINAPALTSYLLTEENFKTITENNDLYELTSAYCNLLYNVCCNDAVINYYEPQNFKNVIGWKNPLFKGINANDSKDLINFMLEEMNQELLKLNQQNNNNLGNDRQINQTNKYEVLNAFKSDFARNNNSIIAQNFFFITENKIRCDVCKIIKYNYQVLAK